MKKIICLAFSLITIFNINAQINNPTNFLSLMNLKPNSSELLIDGCFYTASNSLNNKFINSLYNGNYIDNDLKNSVKLNSKNVFGVEAKYGLQYSFRADSILKISNSTLVVSLSNNYFSDISFSDDYFTLVFFGNSAIPEANLSGFDLSFLNYQKFSLGFSKSFETEKWKTTTAFSLSAIKGQTFYSLNIDDAYFNTINYGESVEASMNYNFETSDTANFDFDDFNGFGVGFDLFFALENKNSGNMFYVELLDFGSINWNKNSLQVAADTAFSFEGQDINNLLDHSFTSFSEMNEDSLRNDFYYSKANQKKTSTRLPAKFGVHYLLNIEKLNTKIFIGGQSYLFSNMVSPYFYTRIKPEFKKDFSLILQFSHGGYTDFQFGLGFEKTFYQKIKIAVFSSNVSGFVNSENSYAQQLRASLSYKF